MKIYLSVAFVMLLALPLAFNSCQKGIGQALGVSATDSSSNCYLRKAQQLSTPFVSDKVVFEEGQSSYSQKAQARIISARTSLAVKIQTQCALSAPASSFAALLASQKTIDPELDVQVLSYSLPQDTAQAQLEEQMQADSCVLAVSYNRNYKANGVVTYNDPYAPNQTHFVPLEAETAFEEFYNSTYGMEQTGLPLVKIAVVDTGADYEHADLSAHIWREGTRMGYDATVVDPNSPQRYLPMDVSNISHGTHVAGLIGAVSSNSLGVFGAMPFRVQLIIVKVFSANMESFSNQVINGMQWAIQNGANVINLSLNWEYAMAADDLMLKAAIQEAVNQGVFVSGVIGNSATGSGKLIDGITITTLPGKYGPEIPGMMTVGAFDVMQPTAGQYRRSITTHFSPNWVEIAAPGFHDASTGLWSTRKLDTYGYLGGTSMAAPLVSAAAGLSIGILSHAYKAKPSPAVVEQLIHDSAVLDASLSADFKQGARLSYFNLIKKIHETYPATKGAPVGTCL